MDGCKRFAWPIFFYAGQVFSIQFWECKIFTLVDIRFLNKHKLGVSEFSELEKSK